MKGEQRFFQSSELTETSNRFEKGRNDPHMWLEPAVLFAIHKVCGNVMSAKLLLERSFHCFNGLGIEKTKLNNLFVEKYGDIMIICVH